MARVRSGWPIPQEPRWTRCVSLGLGCLPIGHRLLSAALDLPWGSCRGGCPCCARPHLILKRDLFVTSSAPFPPQSSLPCLIGWVSPRGQTLCQLKKKWRSDYLCPERASESRGSEWTWEGNRHRSGESFLGPGQRRACL